MPWVDMGVFAWGSWHGMARPPLPLTAAVARHLSTDAIMRGESSFITFACPGDRDCAQLSYRSTSKYDKKNQD